MDIVSRLWLLPLSDAETSFRLVNTTTRIQRAIRLPVSIGYFFMWVVLVVLIIVVNCAVGSKAVVSDKKVLTKYYNDTYLENLLGFVLR